MLEGIDAILNWTTALSNLLMPAVGTTRQAARTRGESESRQMLDVGRSGVYLRPMPEQYKQTAENSLMERS